MRFRGGTMVVVSGFVLFAPAAQAGCFGYLRDLFFPRAVDPLAHLPPAVRANVETDRAFDTRSEHPTFETNGFGDFGILGVYGSPGQAVTGYSARIVSTDGRYLSPEGDYEGSVLRGTGFSLLGSHGSADRAVLWSALRARPGVAYLTIVKLPDGIAEDARRTLVDSERARRRPNAGPMLVFRRRFLPSEALLLQRLRDAASPLYLQTEQEVRRLEQALRTAEGPERITLTGTLTDARRRCEELRRVLALEIPPNALPNLYEPNPPPSTYLHPLRLSAEPVKRMAVRRDGEGRFELVEIDELPGTPRRFSVRPLRGSFGEASVVGEDILANPAHDYRVFAGD